jgi:ABC-type multidrug transport system fused ATPase/permease subunit
MPSHLGPSSFSRAPKLTKVMPEIWKLVIPRRWPLVGSFLLMILNRLCSFAMPISSRYLINNVMYQHQINKLPLIIGTVAGATLIQGTTNYILDRYLAVTGQRLVTELRIRVQQHIGRLSISFYDENRAGALAARIMTDVEGVRNLIGAGLWDLVGGVLTGIIALVILVQISPILTTFTICIVIAFSWFLKRTFGVTRPLFRERSRINAEVTGRLTESIGGVRVVKGYHAKPASLLVALTAFFRTSPDRSSLKLLCRSVSRWSLELLARSLCTSERGRLWRIVSTSVATWNSQCFWLS